MKNFKFKSALVILVTALSMSATAEDRHNFTSNALGNILGLFNLEYSYKVLSQATLGITAYTGDATIDNYKLDGNSFGLVSRIYAKPAFEESAWFLIAAVDKKDFDISRTENGIKYAGKSDDVVGSIGVGYHWFWDSFNVSLGALATSQKKIELTDSSGNRYGDRMDAKLSFDFTVGGKF